MLNYLATSSSAFMILMIFSLLLFMAFSSLGVPLASKNECHPRECNSCNQNANTQIMLLYSCRSQPNTQELKRKKKKKRIACQAGSPLLIHIHITYSVCFCMVYGRNTWGQLCILPLATSSDLYNSFTKWQPISGNGMTKQQPPPSSFLFACPQLPVVATTLL
jgi:hypothetical protein